MAFNGARKIWVHDYLNLQSYEEWGKGDARCRMQWQADIVKMFYERGISGFHA